MGLRLAVEFGKHLPTFGVHIKTSRVREHRSEKDLTLEVTKDELRSASHIRVTTTLAELQCCRVFIDALPTPIDRHRQPDLRPLQIASESVAKVVKGGDIVIYASTVYPGCTEEICAPILERHSRMTFNWDLFVGYSPGRINPGDREHRLANITSGSTPQTAEFVDRHYRTVVAAGTRPEVVLAGRRLNDETARYIANEVIRRMTGTRIHVKGSNVLGMGITFKKDCPDLRNSNAVSRVHRLQEYGARADVHDPWTRAPEARREYGLHLVRTPRRGQYDGIVIAVGHREFRSRKPAAVQAYGRCPHVLCDVPHVLRKKDVDGRL